MRPKNFWDLFHKAWGKDADRALPRPTDRNDISVNPEYYYDKEAWMYVQAKIEKFLREAKVK